MFGQKKIFFSSKLYFYDRKFPPFQIWDAMKNSQKNFKYNLIKPN